MNFEDIEINNTDGFLSKTKVKGVIFLTDNRSRIQAISDFEQNIKLSAYRGILFYI
jgi:hypothetical protein